MDLRMDTDESIVEKTIDTEVGTVSEMESFNESDFSVYIRLYRDELTLKNVSMYKSVLDDFNRGVSLLGNVRRRRVPELSLIHKKQEDAMQCMQQILNPIHAMFQERIIKMMSEWEQACDVTMVQASDDVLAQVYPMQSTTDSTNVSVVHTQ